jgi:hypothetical protein
MRPVCRYPVGVVAAVLLCGVVLSCGCSSVATRRGFYDPIVADVRAEDYPAAVTKIEKAREDNKFTNKERFLYFLDAGLALHYAGNYQLSNEKLHAAEQAAEELFTKSVSRAAVSILLNDNALEYSGEDYEILYANLIKALNYLALGEFDDAFVEIRRANNKLALLEDKYAEAAREYQRGAEIDTAKTGIIYEPKHVRFYNDAFARYLSMHLYAADGKPDDARIDYDFLTEAFEAQPFVYNFAQPEASYHAGDKAILSVVALGGLGPRKEAFTLRLRTDKDIGLVQVLYTDSDGREAEYGHLPLPVKADYYFKFAIPRVESRPSDIGRICLLANGIEVGELRLLEDVAAVAEETFAAKKSLIYLRSVARAVAKGLVAHNMKNKADTGGLEGWLKKAAIDVATDVSENADLRSAQLLPGKIYVGDFALQPGVYDLAVEFYTPDGLLLSRDLFTGYNVTSSGLNFIEAISPR